MKKKILIGLLGLILLLGTGVISLAATKEKVSAPADAKGETETETESETETDSETESENTVSYAPDLTLHGVIVDGYAGTITLQTDDGEEYVISFVNAKTDFSDSGLYEGMAVKCVLEDIASDEDGIFSAEEITTDKTWE